MNKRFIALLVLVIVATTMLTGCSIHIFLPLRESTITFDSRGGSAVESIVDTEGAIVRAPEAPTRAGYEFVGWCSDSECTTLYQFTVMPNADITLYAKWNRVIKITFETNGGSAVAPIIGGAGSYIEAPQAPTKTDYKFAGWYKDSAFRELYFFSTMPSEDIILHAKWLGKKEVTFVSNGGSDVDKIVGYEGDKIIAPTAPTRIGYKFAGWYRDKACTQKYEFATMPSENITLYAKWDSERYNITLNGNGGHGSIVSEYNTGDEVILPTNWTRIGFKFAGWYEDSEFIGNRIYKIDAGDIGNREYWAKWMVAIPDYYIVTLNGNGGTGSGLDKYYKADGAILPTDWKRAGYTFGGWFDNVTCQGSAVSAIEKNSEGDKIFYAKWIPNTYTITFDSNGGSSVASITAPYDSVIKAPEEPTYGTKLFLGWYSDYACKNEFVFDKMPLGDKILYAKWSNDVYTITFDSNGGSDVPSMSVPYGSAIYAPDIPTKANKLFGGWYSDPALNNIFEFTVMPQRNITLYAKWLDGYKISYVSDGITAYSKDYVYRGTPTPLINPLDYPFNKPDYYFDGWYYDEALSLPCGVEVSPTASIKVYAKWTHRSFIPYITKFSGAGTEAHPIAVNSRREFIALFDYMMYDNTHDEFTFALKYTSGKTNVENEIKKVINLSTNYVTPNIRYSISSTGSWGKIILDPLRQLDNFTPVPNQAGGIKEKLYNGLGAVEPKTRSSSFDNFKYKNSDYSLEVYNSDQLFYALQYGIKPIPKPGSSADRMLVKAKNILRNICDDSMTDLEKTYAIFSWFNREVHYDHTAASMGGSNTLTKYDAWHVEGVLNNRAAVCDGIAKTFTVLAGIEGIPCLRITSQPIPGVVEGHAWNKVYIDVDGNGIREWYNVDATWGNTNVSFSNAFSAEVANGEHFLWSDTDKFEKPRIAENHLDIVANTESKAFEYVTFTHKNNEYNLVIESSAEMLALAEHLHDQINSPGFNSEYITMTVMYDKSVYHNKDSFESSLASKISTVNSTSFKDKDLGSLSSINTNRAVLYMIKIKKTII